MNFLEELVAEWLQQNGWLVSKNVRYGPRPEGGYVGEADLIAFHPDGGEYLHVETSQAAPSKAKLAKKFRDQFRKAKRFYPEMLSGISGEVFKLAIGGWTKEPADPGESIEAMTIPQFVERVSNELLSEEVWTRVTPERFALLRAMELALRYGPGAS